MAATITWDGTNGAGSDGIISTADSATGFTAVKITSGGAGPTAVLSGNPIEGTDSITCRSDNKRVYIYYDIGAANTLDFTGGGNADGEMFYAWAQFLGAGDLLSQSAGGFGIFLESSTPTSSQYHLYYFYGSDNYVGGWKRMVLDPNETASASAGTAIDLTAVRYFGVFAQTNVTAKFDNLVVDQMMVGKGLIVTGTSTTDDLIGDLLADEVTNRYGITIPLNDSESAVELNGSLTLGDVTAATASTITDVDAKIFLAEPKYYDGTSITTSVPTTYFNINCVGGTGTNSVTIGKIVGSNAGRNGWSIVGNSSYTLNMDFDDGNVNTSKWYGCNLTDVTGTLTWGTNTAHHCYSNSLTGCGQFDPVGGVIIRNCFIVGTSNINAALLWNENIDIEDCSFIANTLGSTLSTVSCYFDGSDVAATDAGTDWTNVTNTDDGSTGTTGTWVISSPSIVTIEGTSYSPVAGTDVVSVRARIYGSSVLNPAKCYIYEDGGSTLIGDLTFSGALAYSAYIDLDEHSGGWSNAKVQALEVQLDGVTSSSGSVARVDLEVTYADISSAIEHATWNGTATGTASNTLSETTTLFDTGTSFLTTVAVDDVLYNETDGSYAKVTAIVSDTEITHEALAGGTNNFWTTSDTYSAATPYTYTNLLFSGNTFDGLNSSGTNATVKLLGTSNAALDSGANTIAYDAAISITITVKDESTGSVLQFARINIVNASTKAELYQIETNASGIAIATDNYAGDVAIEGWVRQFDISGTDYVQKNFVGTITSAGLTQTILLTPVTN